MRKFSAACAAALALAALAGAPAKAALYTITYTGHVGGSVNLTDMFGPGVNYDLLPYTLVYTIDDAAPGATIATTGDTSKISGSGVNSPVSAALTVNGITKTILGTELGSVEAQNLNHGNDGGTDYVMQHASEYSYIDKVYYHAYSVQTSITSHVTDFLSSPDYHAPFSYPPVNNGLFSTVSFNDFNYVTNHQDNYAYFNLGIDSVVVARLGDAGVSAAPEPGAWAFMLLGFGGAGALLRRRRAALA